MSSNRFDHIFSWIMALDEGEAARDEGLRSLLEKAGFSEPGRSATNIVLMTAHYSVEQLLRLSLASLHSPSPDLALNGFERLSNVVAPETLIAIMADKRRLAQILTVLGASPFLTTIITRDPTFYHRLFKDFEIDLAKQRKEFLRELRAQIPTGCDIPLLMKQLRRFKRYEILRIAARDLNGLAPLEEVTRELSDLASSTLQVAYETCHRRLEEEYGQPLKETDEGQRPTTMTVMGMGKFGGRELNFSSDIDIIFFYETDQGQTSGIDDGRGGKKGIVPLHTFFNKLAEQVTKTMNQVTEDGFVFRVDVGLRPEGKSGDIAVSMRAAELYYESWGQSWERTAMLKARPVAGSKELGEQILHMLVPFVYRKYLDYTLIEDMKLMKQKIDASLTRHREAESNLKLGRGGIREIEFFIQALQLVYAGKHIKLRERNSLLALSLLAEAKIVSEDDVSKLQEAYRFLRTAEHRIQVVQERQTHSLPSKDDEMRDLARRCGFLREGGLHTFMATLETHRATVSSIYGGLFHNRDEQKQEIPPEILYFLDPNADEDLVKDMLAERRLEDVDKAYDNLRGLRNGPARFTTTERNRRTHHQIAPILVAALLEAPDPDMALANTESFLNAIANKSACYALLAENQETVRVLAVLFGTSAFLSKILISHPELLETMVSRANSAGIKPLEAMMEDLYNLLAQSDYFEDHLDILRRYRNEEFLRIGLNDIHSTLGQGATAIQLTSLAEASLLAAQTLAVKDLERFGEPMAGDGTTKQPANLAIVGMGKLGGCELNYHSDLDIIFIYDYQGITNGTKQISNHEYFAKLAQKIISILSTTTREGYVYKIDTRLRPSGNAGPLVTSLESFTAYHDHEAQVWERQALTKARVVTGPALLAEHVTNVIQQTVYGHSLPEEGRLEIHRLRMRMEHEIAKEGAGNYNIKTGRGGMVDVEFTAQYLQLTHGIHHHQLRSHNTVNTLKGALAAGVLDEKDTETLISGYKFLRKLENRLRLLHDHSISDLARDQHYLDKLARRLGYDTKLRHPGQALLVDYENTTTAIRGTYERIVGTTPAVAQETIPS